MKHEAKNFEHLLGGKTEGLSDDQLTAHFGLYQGYVKKLNEVEEKLGSADRSLTNYSFGEYSELKRREAVAFNGTYLHQMYFENLGSNGERDAVLEDVLKESFGSVENWEKDIKAAAAATPGWIVTTKSRVDGKLHNYMMFEHHIGLPIYQDVVLALDCWEHAFMIDYGTKKADYLACFLKNVNWSKVSERYKAL